MIGTKRLLKVARKWRTITATERKRIPHPNTRRFSNGDDCTMLNASKKGNFVIYTNDRSRFAIPLACLNTLTFRELFKMSEEEYGLSSDGPIILPFDASVLEYTVILLQDGLGEDSQRALLDAISSRHCSSSVSLYQGYIGQHSTVNY